MKQAKRWLAVLLAMTLLVCYGTTGLVLPVAAETAAGDSDVAATMCGETATYTLDDAGNLVISGTGAVDANSFDGRTDIVTVTVEEGITELGMNVFRGCTSLREVNLPAGLVTIKFGAFQNCSALTAIVLPEGLISMEANVFRFCTGLTSVTLPSDLTELGTCVFDGCSSLTELYVPYQVTTIGNFAFRGCTSLTLHVYKLSYAQAYAQNNNIPYVLLENEIVESGSCGTNVTYTMDGQGNLIVSGTGAIATAAFDGRANLVSVTIEEGVTGIGVNAFRGCTRMLSVSIPQSVKTLGFGAFNGCKSLSKMSIPDSVTTLGGSAFLNCTRLTEVTLPANLVTIESSVFDGCTNLTTVTIPDSVVSIGGYVFRGCNNVTIRGCEGSYAYTYAIYNGLNYQLTEAGTVVETGSCGTNLTYTLDDHGHLVISGTGAMEATAFDGRTDIKTVTVETGVTSVGTNAFRNCTSLVAVNLPRKVTAVNFGAFNGCTALAQIILPNTITKIGGSAFLNCKSLTTVKVPLGLKSLDSRTFDGCAKLNTVTVPLTISSIGTNVFRGCAENLTMKVHSGSYAETYATENSITTALLPKTTNPLRLVAVGRVPFQKEFFLGERLNLRGIVVNLTYLDGTTEIPLLGYTVTGFDSETVGEKKITVTYEGVSDTFSVQVNEFELTDISVATAPTKTTYEIGETLDTTGLTLLRTYANGETKVLTDGFTVGSVDTSTSGEKTVDVSYNGLTTTFAVAVNKAPLSGVSVTSPTKYGYFLGEELDTTGLELLLTYENGETEVVTDGFTVYGFDMWMMGPQTVTVEYEGHTATFPIEVTERMVMEVAIETYPERLDYFIGEQLDTTGLTLRVTYEGGLTEIVDSGFTVMPEFLDIVGPMPVEISYNGYSVMLDVYVSPIFPNLMELSVMTPPYKVEYLLGESFDSSGMVLEARYDDGTTQQIYDGYRVEGFESDSYGEKIVYIYYMDPASGMEMMTEYSVMVQEARPREMYVVTLPNKTEYRIGEELDTTGLMLDVMYEDGRHETITDGYEVGPFDPYMAGEQSIFVFYGGAVTEFIVTVMENPTVVGVTFAATPDKTEFFVGEQLDLSQGLLVTYDNGNTEIITDNYFVDGFDSSTPGQRTLEIHINLSDMTGVTVSLDVTVVEPEVTDVIIHTLPQKTEYVVGETLDTTGLTLAVAYENGKTETVSDGYTVKSAEFTCAGQQTVTLVYGRFTVTFTVDVREPKVTGVEVKTPPYKTQYFVGETLDAAGLELLVVYENGKQQIVTGDTVECVYHFANAGVSVVTVNYTDAGYGTLFTTSFEVDVIAVAVNGMTLVTPPGKMEYLIGEAFEMDGLLLHVTYNNGTEAYVHEGVTVVGFDSETVGEKKITVMYEGYTAEFSVFVREPMPVAIEVSQRPYKDEYFVGDALDATGLTVMVTYENGTTAFITDGFTVGEFDSTIEGEQEIAVTYDGLTSWFTVRVRLPWIVGIEIDSAPYKTEYLVGETLDTEGLALRLNYCDGSYAVVVGGFGVGAFDSYLVGEQTVTVFFEDYTATFVITVSEPVIDEYAPRFEVSTEEARVGNTVDVTISTVNNSGIVSLKLWVGYDAEMLELVAVNGKDFVSGAFGTGPLTANPIAVNWINTLAPNNTTDGVVAVLTFRVKDTAAAGYTPITVTYDGADVFDQNYEDVAFEVLNGGINVQDYVMGDVNNDGTINNKDLGLLMQYLNGHDVTVNVNACDVVADGAVNNKDFSELMRYLNGWDVTLG